MEDFDIFRKSFLKELEASLFFSLIDNEKKLQILSGVKNSTEEKLLIVVNDFREKENRLQQIDKEIKDVDQKQKALEEERRIFREELEKRIVLDKRECEKIADELIEKLERGEIGDPDDDKKEEKEVPKKKKLFGII
jgi:hypothetical protein